ncbi:MAG: acyl-[acyl-carrier-protein] thioesterase [Prevotellaceae bacterium]|jgi:acyl-ACP thioesterase|nr:acyl-[acyl-carrier-protein] thioesterase [Prevotellaceae bacterium]
MQKLGTYEFNIDAYSTDFRGKATLSLISNFLLQVATKHAEKRGFGYSYMNERNIAWVFSRLMIEIYEYPHNDMKIKVNTWVSDTNKFFSERSFSIENEEGKIIGYARSLWAAIDVTTRRPTNLLNLQGLADFKLEHPCPIDGMKKIFPLKDEEPLGKFTVRYSDVDINNHLNSVKYIEHFVDMFDVELFKTKDIQRFEISYQNEVRFGTRVKLYKKEEADGVFILEMRSDDCTVSSARVIWK